NAETILVVSSDHGENFDIDITSSSDLLRGSGKNSHHGVWMGCPVQTTQVPFYMMFSDFSDEPWVMGASITTHQDIMPTILQLLGFDFDNKAWHGVMQGKTMVWKEKEESGRRKVGWT